ncbi:protein NDNF-like [Amphibalanus amphitrite]|uniref:protein NDNF-like n=1 Tax=Amphibalanus amphitrite TaxID=1232801 RepID=UPI001C902350|nr:protein NDNF-like [Amphibalanus amphitrite]
MRTFPVTVALLLSLANPSAPASNNDRSQDNLEVDSDDPGDLEVSFGEPTAGQERLLRAASASQKKLQPKHVLPINKQVSAFLPAGTYKRFLYRQSRDGVAISLVVTPCSASLRGQITFQPDKIREGGKREVLRTINGPDQVIYSARRGLTGDYDVNISSSADTYVHFLATDEDLAGLGSLRTKVQVRSRSKSRAEISWSPGSHGGQALSYCLITSPTQHFSSVCGGLSAKFGLQPPESGGARRRRQQGASPPRRQGPEPNDSITVGCVGKTTVYTLYDLLPGRKYFVTVFGQYANRSVSFQYGTAEFRYQDRSERTSMRIRQNRVTKLRLSPWRPFRILELRVPAKYERLHYFVVPCGGPLSLQVNRTYNSPGVSDESVLIQEVNISSDVLIRSDLNSSRLTVGNVRYQFNLTAPGGATTVEFQATWRRGRLRVASLPGRPRVRAAGPRRRARLGLNCSQLALRMPRARGRRLEYCVLLELDTTGRTGRRFKAPSACGLELRHAHHPANMTRCGSSKQLRRRKRVEVIFDDLTPGQSYVVRAMVRPDKGRFIPYSLSQVTLPPCSDEVPNELTEDNIAGLQPIGAQGSGTRTSAEQTGSSRPASADSRAEAAEETNNELTDWTP